MKKIAIRKLNRTQLKKEATKEVYITGKILLDFFGYNSIDELATSRRDPNAKKRFYHKKDYFYHDNPVSFLLNVTKENNEVRLTGFSEHLPDDVKETDDIVLESIESPEGIIYLFDVVKKENVLVLQKFALSDDEENYNKSNNANGVIQFQLKENADLKIKDSYWMWDDNVTQDKFEEFIGKPIDAMIIYRGKLAKKKIKIVPTHVSFSKLLRAISNSNNSVETQNKELYIIEEENAGEWIKVNDIEFAWLEVTYISGHLVITARNANSFVYYGGM